ncbi:hypothetical protein ABW21_db0201112 [Orbilia brochopaga]|nr:hypothetical protein ABW21_db0201112 [Drechslerella brochopaga]
MMRPASILTRQTRIVGPCARCFHSSWRPIPSSGSRGFILINHATRRAYSSSQHQRPFFERLKTAWNETPVKWYPIPVGLGIAFLGFKHYLDVMARERQLAEDERQSMDPKDPRKRKVRATGPWQVQILSTLPLKALSRLWGKFNEIPLPVFLRPAGFRLYAFIFGVNISEAKNQDLKSYRNLAEFFYREIDPAVRPVDLSAAIVSPSDGKVLMLGEVREGGQKGAEGTTAATAPGGEVVDSDEEFARMNGISYTVGELFSGVEAEKHTPDGAEDQSLPPAELKGDVAAAVGPKGTNWFRSQLDGTKRLYFAVVYLAPGDYHRFHSPTEWVVETRRHFAGELFSVSPYLQALLPSLFVLNERVVLLGRWRYGFFSMTPVGATNVGSIILNFDRELRTNSLTKDTRADSLEGHGYAEAHYQLASKLLGGHPLRRGEEMGGFRLGSTVVMVFEAPEGHEGKGFRWIVEKGRVVRMGEPLGVVE